jgi:two-component system NtrC family sensor kinase
MGVRIPCPNCGRPLSAPREREGKKVRCANCGETFVLKLAIADATSIAPPETQVPVPPQPPNFIAPGPPPAITPPRVSQEATVSRSMLLPLPGLHHAPAGAMICRLAPDELSWIDISPAARAFFGEDQGTAAPATFLDAVHPDDRALAREEFRRAAELGERHDLVLRVQTAAGGWHFVRLDAQARYDRDGRLNHVRCHFVDVTDRISEVQELRRRTEQLTAANEQLRLTNERLKEAQAQLVQSEKLAAIGTLAAGMAHEINNPLAFASNNAAVLERDTTAVLEILAAYQEARGAIEAALPELAARIDGLEGQAELPYIQEHLVGVAGSMRRGLKRVAQIVAGLRDFARLDRSRVTDVNPNESLEQSLALLGEHLERAHIEAVRDYGEVPAIECAAASINQVLFHLLINAVQAVEDGGKGSGRIGVATRVEGNDIVIEVADDGCGIPPEILPRIFDPFYTTKPVGRGTGLGLSTCHGIVAEQGGRIEVESIPGEGSLFRVRLPLRQAPATSKTP